MTSEKLNFPAGRFPFVEDINLHNKSKRELKNNYVSCVGGKAYILTDAEFKGMLEFLNDCPGQIQIDGKSVIYTSQRKKQGVTSVRPY